MGRESRQNETAQAAGDGKLLSRQSIIGAMDHALEMHAAAIRTLDLKIHALKVRLEAVEKMFSIGVPIPAAQSPEAVMDISPSIQSVTINAMPRQSAQPCGCDAGVNWTCEAHRVNAD